MIRGMTGFSSSTFSCQGRRWVINIRCVNHKFLDCVINLPDDLLAIDDKIKKELRKVLYRGRIVFQLISVDPPVRQLALNKKLLSAYLLCMKNISRSLRIKMDIAVNDIIRLPEVISLRPVGGYEQKAFSVACTRAVRGALKKLLSLRKQEGRAICVELQKRTKTIHRRLAMIQARAAVLIADKKKRFTNDELRDFLKSYNIQEEVNRLKFHLTTFRKTLMQSGSLGKVLDFIAQEMQREVNTLSAKFRDARVSYLSVIIKDEIEKVREQLQNVE